MKRTGKKKIDSKNEVSNDHTKDHEMGKGHLTGRLFAQTRFVRTEAEEETFHLKAFARKHRELYD